MSEHQASRTLLKSPPELWAECSDAQSLARHLDEFFGEIRITRLEPEQAVAWEGERVSGTVKLEPSGWGTKVTLTAIAPEPELAEPETEEAPEPPPPMPPPAASTPEPAPRSIAPEPPARPGRMGFIGRIRYLLSAPVPAPSRQSPPVPEPVVVAPPKPTAPPEPEPLADVPPAETPEAEAALSAALDSLGMAHHRPFSRG